MLDRTANSDAMYTQTIKNYTTDAQPHPRLGEWQIDACQWTIRATIKHSHANTNKAKTQARETLNKHRAGCEPRAGFLHLEELCVSHLARRSSVLPDGLRSPSQPLTAVRTRSRVQRQAVSVVMCQEWCKYEASTVYLRGSLRGAHVSASTIC